MSWIIASSTTVARFRYHLETQILEIEFKSGTVYRYFDVPSIVYKNFVNQVDSGGSAGQYFNAHIRGCFRYARV
ncbi:KTSC domain-containing protein [Sporomusa termitida]|uniref:KTSC domain protein n=1 Tax=Sporomusa termitida TaxID=2377 RepID=A0A517DZD0_9FIRM|nr:KTSC domain-containing protein [Sporomusa termitida]QDR82709.1 KTSC domain protein [Sporomusa termitida]